MESYGETCIVTKVGIKPECKNAFIDWQAQLNTCITEFEGFISLEFQAPTNEDAVWVMVQRFKDINSRALWKSSPKRKSLFKELASFAVDACFDDQEKEGIYSRGGVTEVFVTKVSPDKEKSFKEWLAKIHQAEAKFPGFQGMFIQSPSSSESHNWITFLQFDTQEHLEFWLNSNERKSILVEAKNIMQSLESHRVISPFAGWFSSISQEQKIPSAWKQTMLVLLVLFPIVMMEFRFLSPYTSFLNISLATFIGNAISVSLISWPLMPIVLRLFSWWFSEDPSKRDYFRTFLGIVLILSLYLFAIYLFWG